MKLKSQKSKVKIVFYLLLITYYLLHPSPVLAQSFSLSIYPPLLELMIMPGKSVIQAYQLTNNAEQTLVKAQILPFSPADEKGNIKLLSPKTNQLKTNWFNFENADLSLDKPFILKPGETKQIILKVKIPEDAQEDDYYFTLLFSSVPQDIRLNPGTQESGMIGTNLLITVSKTGEPLKKGETLEFRLKNALSSLFNFQLIDSFHQPDFFIRIKNTGRAFWKPFGTLRVEGLVKQKWTQELIPDNILADSVREIKVGTSSALPAFLIGPYRAQIEFKPDQEAKTFTASTVFVALPLKATLGLLIGFLLILTISGKLKRRT